MPNLCKKMLDKLSEWCGKWRLTINSDKTKIIHFRPLSQTRCNFNFTCGNIEVDLTDRYKYLGFWFQENLDMKFATSELAKSAGRALSALYAKLKSAGGMAYDVYKKVQVGKDQEKAQSEKDSHSKNRGGKKPN